MPNSCTTFALISMLFYQLEANDWTGAYVREALLDHKKAFNHVHHNLLIPKFYNLGVKPTVVTWVIDFFRGRSKPVKLSSDCFSDFTPVPAGISQGARIGPWLSLVLATSCSLVSGMWKFVDDTTVPAIFPQVRCDKDPRDSGSCPSVVKRPQIQAELA